MDGRSDDHSTWTDCFSAIFYDFMRKITQDYDTLLQLDHMTDIDPIMECALSKHHATPSMVFSKAHVLIGVGGSLSVHERARIPDDVRDWFQHPKIAVGSQQCKADLDIRNSVKQTILRMV